LELFLEYEDLNSKLHSIKMRWSNCVAMGYTGRNREKVKAHIRELQSLGVSVPSRVPSMYWIDPDSKITTSDIIYVIGEKTSGEVEFFLMPSINDSIYFTVASDHTDRELEKISVSKAKQICNKVIAKKCWKVSDVYDHWDEIEIGAYVGINSEHDLMLYQKGKLKDILDPMELRKLAIEDVPYNGEVSILSGTLPLLKEKTIFGNVYKIFMFDPVLKRSIEHEYKVVILPDRS